MEYKKSEALWVLGVSQWEEDLAFPDLTVASLYLLNLKKVHINSFEVKLT